VHVFVARSEDGGRIWSTPAKVDTTLDNSATSARIVQGDDGDLLLAMYGSRGGARDAMAVVIRSADDGRTWLKNSEATIASAPGVSFVEPALATLGGGRLLAMIRTEGAERAAHESYSVDGGRTWSDPVKTTLVAQASDLLLIDNDGGRPLVAHTWGDTSRQFGDSRPTMLQFIRFREFPTARWVSEPRVLHQGHCFSDEGYPSSVRLGDGRVLTVYYDACAGYVGGAFTAVIDPSIGANCEGPPAPPTDLAVTSNENGTVSLAWRPAAAAETRTAYVLEAGRSSGASDALTIDVGAQTVYTATNVAPGTYFVRVRGRNACGTSGASGEVTLVIR
jgi:hypothetical protein